MTVGLLCAVGAAVCYGIASVMQAMAARATSRAESLDPRLLLRLFRSWRYLVGTGLDLLGFVLTVVALQSLPLFVVQSVVASFLAVTAVVGVFTLGLTLRAADWVGVGVVVVGLVLVAMAAAPERAEAVSSAERWGVLIATVALGVLAVPLGRLQGAAAAASLGALAGLAYGASSVAARMLPDLDLDTLGADLRGLVDDPAAYALLAAGGVATLCYATALQRGTVTQATAPLVVGETLVPAIVGVLLLGDRARAGWEGVAVVGFVLAVAGALALARHGEVPAEEPGESPAPKTGEGRNRPSPAGADSG